MWLCSGIILDSVFRDYSCRTQGTMWLNTGWSSASKLVNHYTVFLLLLLIFQKQIEETVEPISIFGSAPLQETIKSLYQI